MFELGRASCAHCTHPQTDKQELFFPNIRNTETVLTFIWIYFRSKYSFSSYADVFIFHKKSTTEFCVGFEWIVCVCVWVCINKVKNRMIHVKKYTWKKSDLFHGMHYSLIAFRMLLITWLFVSTPLVPFQCSAFVQCSFQLLAAHREQRNENKYIWGPFYVLFLRNKNLLAEDIAHVLCIGSR